MVHIDGHRWPCYFANNKFTIAYIDGHCWRFLFPPTIDSQGGHHYSHRHPHGPCFLHILFLWPSSSNCVCHPMTGSKIFNVHRWMVRIDGRSWSTTADFCLYESNRVTPIKCRRNMQDLTLCVFSYREVRFDVVLPNPTAPYDFAFNKTSTQLKICALHRSVGFLSQKTAPRFDATSWKHMQLSTNVRPSESANYFLERSSPNIFILLHLTSLARARLMATNICAVNFVSYTPYVLEYPFSLLLDVNIPKVVFRLNEKIVITLTLFRNVCTIWIFRNAGAVKGTTEGKHSITP